MDAFTPWPSLAGGMLIGLSASGVLVLLGRVAGISGILGGLLTGQAGGGRGEQAAEAPWRAMFVAGLLAGGMLASSWSPALVAMSLDRSLPVLLAAGFLVGVGTRMGSGCTSGHGVCGMARGSLRSVSATATFMATGAATAMVVTQVFGGSL